MSSRPTGLATTQPGPRVREAPRVKRQKTEEVEVPITPMLDMAFQLLTFFILTYHPAPTEGQFSMNLLPAQPTVSLETPSGDKNATNNDLPAGVKTLPTTLRAGDNGELTEIFIEDNKIDGLDALAKELAEIFKDKNALPFDQTLIKVDPKLKYAELVRVIDLFSKHITKISFVELGSGAGGEPGVAP
jgi:biopolymer transport protein ExbD